MNHIMIDIETLGKAPLGAIVQIAALQFDPETGSRGEHFCMNVDLASSQLAGMRISADTVLWWMEQSQEARFEVFANSEIRKDTPAPALKDVLSLFAAFLYDISDAYEDVVVWANGAQFDLVILKSAFELCQMNVPWKWQNERDARTIYKLFPGVKESHKFEGTAHHGLDDCRNQVAMLIKCFDLIYRGGIVRRCRQCGCTDDDCSGCIERAGQACYWIEGDLCSACAPPQQSVPSWTSL